MSDGFVGRVLRLGMLSLGVWVAPVGLMAAGSSLTLPPSTVGDPVFIHDSCGKGHEEPYVWQISTSTMADILPAGIGAAISQNRDLVLRGTPTEPGTYQFTALPFTALEIPLAELLLTLQVRPLTDTPVILVGEGSRVGMVGAAFGSQPVVKVAGGEGPYVWGMVQGGLPTGLHFTSQGVIEGVPTVAGQYQFQASVVDARGRRSSAPVTITVSDAIASASSAPVSTGMLPMVPVSSVPFVAPSSLSLPDRQALLTRLGVMTNTLVQTSEIDPLMQRTAVYYIGADGRRHPFQDEHAYESWYGSSVAASRTLSRSDVTSIPFGDAITYRPGERVRFQSGTDTYVVSEAKTLQRLSSEQGVLSWVWERGVQELSGIYRGAYRVLSEVAGISSNDPSATRARYSTPNDVLMGS